MAGLLGRKIGMTRVYTEDGRQVPVTVLEAGPCHVSQIKTPEKDGYAAVQVAFDDVKARRSTMPQIGHDLKAGLSPKRMHREFRIDESELENFEVGQELTIEHLADVQFVDVSGRSKGKGFQGVMKRHGFKGQLQTHGVERKHRSPGSISSHASNAGLSGKIKKGKKMGGQMGNRRVTVRALDIIQRDAENHVLLVKGPVPGPNNEIVEIRPAKRIYKVKQNLLQAG